MKYPIGIQSFATLRKSGFVYIDKTDLVYKLVNNYTYTFLGRPRRFGKSLLMSTIQAYFEGRKELFEGLAIERLETDWTKYPVLHFDLNTGDYQNNGREEVINVLNYQLQKYEEIYGGIDDTPTNRFLNLIRSAYKHTGQEVVVLIDEYDKPILTRIGSEDEDSIRSTLKSFYGCLKSSNEYIKFVMLTGVSKFGKLSVFSDLNNVEDISLNKDYACICGLTEEEILSTFEEEITGIARDYGISLPEVIDKLRIKYDGYRFSKSDALVYNPFSLLNAIKNRELRDYWFESGTPTFLVKLLKDNDYKLSDLDGVEVAADSLYKIDNLSAVPILYQSGYLTIKGYMPEAELYVLGYPNQEVEAGFLNFILPYYSHISSSDTKSDLYRLVNEINRGEVQSFMERLKSIFHSIPYSQDNSAKVHEDQFRNLLYIIFKLIGIKIQVECPMSKGRSDAIIWAKDRIYIFEFKINSSAEKALEQIHKKAYYAPFMADGRKVILIGVNYSTTDRGITSWKAEE